MKHPADMDCNLSLEELGKNIARMRYDAIFLVLKGMRSEFASQIKNDTRAQRWKLVESGTMMLLGLRVVTNALETSLRISIPYMKEELQKIPLLIKLRKR